jgi:hypothetical protein
MRWRWKKEDERPEQHREEGEAEGPRKRRHENRRNLGKKGGSAIAGRRARG